jgi:membrane-associated phospholipid phosphatase
MAPREEGAAPHVVGTLIDQKVLRKRLKTHPREPFLGWPGSHVLRYFAFLVLAQSLWFGAIFGGADYLTAKREFRVRVHLDAELKLPFVPEMVTIYMSIYLLFWSAPFILRTQRQLRALAITLAAVTLCGGICFLLLPAEVAFPPPRELGGWAQLFHFADWLNLDYNLVPSLHVAFSVVCVAVFSGRARTTGGIVLWSWAVAVSVSTLLTHQHHILDVITGFILGILATKLVYNRLGPFEPEA